ncbi:MAG: endonuclease [Flavobacteriaceae bacterium]|nr:endonuclease [Flavobacteriaceae bacterium]|tara:strand:+ start:438090 stop:438449 length:360 start_codon:yes stop_codon:yes gene_type:complete
MASHNELGALGEILALEYLRAHQYQILEKNYRYQKAEVDLIAFKEGTLTAIEVKTRTSDFFGDPQDFVSTKKIKLLVTAIDHYVTENDLDVEVRFDIIAIVKNEMETKIEHLENAFLHY